MPVLAWMLAVWILAYLVGAIPFGFLLAKMRGVDIFKEGSGNIGATNVARVLGKKLGVLVFLLDFAKGAGPVALALTLRPVITADSSDAVSKGWLEVGAGLAAFLGHLFPVYLGFRGGKGVATGAGVVLVLTPLATLAALSAWIVALAAWRYVSLASLTAALTLCGVQLGLAGEVAFVNPRTLFCFLACALVFARHRANIRRLLYGQETQIKNEGAMEQFAKTLHVLAMGLWFGSNVFFTFVVGLSLFGASERIGERDGRPDWFPLPEGFRKMDAHIDGPREQGVRVAGHAVEPMFPVYFTLQGLCGLAALATALGWARAYRAEKVHHWRNVILMLALVTVLAGWPLERRVSELRGPRDAMTDAYLQSTTANAAALEAMKAARADFGRWHFYSLMLNFTTTLFVTAGMALTAQLPRRQGSA
ncbi:MAG: glycerol-3-phosphate 1-O-acyltransferase PlsY [Planctomycetes bacterium]|nr:glycerol-3-phosphate 1-O-acyltransferase PlsY [Planctomycetota bacterium]